MLVDSHAHLNFQAYDADRDEVVGRVIAADMIVINAASQMANSRTAVDLAEQYPGRLYAAVGFHPCHVNDTDYSLKEFQDFTRNHRSQISAIGEIGLDYYRLPDDDTRVATVARQKEIFRAMCGLAREFDLPLIVHCRDAYEDLLAELEKLGSSHRGVIHCYLGPPELAERFLRLGFHLGFTGIITFTKDEQLLNIVRSMPLDKMLIETDAPYLTPVPHRGQRNEPPYVQFVAAKLAALRQEPISAIIQATGANAITLFNLNSQ